MSKVGTIITTIVCVLVVIAIGFTIYFTATPSGRSTWNNYKAGLQKVDDDTLYKTRKEVEDTCRGMIASYKADKLTYEQYKDASETEQRGWADAAKLRANRTATTYNEYIIKNTYVWKDNVPADIYMVLEYLN